MDSYTAYICLNMLPGLGPVRVKAMLERFGAAEEIFKQSFHSLKQVPGLGPKLAQIVLNWSSQVDLDQELRRIEQAGVRVLTPTDDDYPHFFRELHASPLCLYVRGQLEALQRPNTSIAVVGSRKMSYYGKEMTERLVAPAVFSQWTVVSGMAQGIDTVAHRCTLDHGGVTVAVLGSGLGRLYPQENCKLAAEIIERGAVVSEFPMTYPPDRRSFPMRNRIIAALSRGILLVEAGKKSGSLITAQLGLEQGKEIFAVPGPVNSPTSQGCHQLIKDGAHLVESFDDVLEEFRFLPLFDLAPSYGGEALEQKKTQVIAEAHLQLTEIEQKILRFLGHEQYSIDQIVVAIEQPLGQTFATLTAMETKRLIKPLPGTKYVAIK